MAGKSVIKQVRLVEKAITEINHVTEFQNWHKVLD